MKKIAADKNYRMFKRANPLRGYDQYYVPTEEDIKFTALELAQEDNWYCDGSGQESAGDADDGTDPRESRGQGDCYNESIDWSKWEHQIIKEYRDRAISKIKYLGRPTAPIPG